MKKLILIIFILFITIITVYLSFGYRRDSNPNTFYKVYLNKLKQEKVFYNLLTDTTSRKIKKVLLTLSPIIYFKLKG